ncbi:MAG: nitrogenase-stabilizing/protective protein NifW [Sedimenticola sp.]
MSESELDLDLEELSSAEDFLEYFEIDFDPAVVHVNRLHILQRFHDYIENIQEMPEDDDELRLLYAGMLKSAYSDFVKSDAITEKVFKVFRMHEPVSVEIPLMEITTQVDSGAPKV